MNDLQTRLELQGSIQQYIESLLNQGISAAMVEDALNKALLYVKDKAVTEFLIVAQQANMQVLEEHEQEMYNKQNLQEVDE